MCLYVCAYGHTRVEPHTHAQALETRHHHTQLPYKAKLLLVHFFMTILFKPFELHGAYYIIVFLCLKYFEDYLAFRKFKNIIQGWDYFGGMFL